MITLISDIGHRDYLVGAIKGRLLSIDPQFQLVDISHEVAPFNYPQAAYITRNAIKYFPPYSYHLIFINLYERPPQQLLLCYHNNQYIICADNGLLNMIIEDRPELVIGLPLNVFENRNTLYLAEIMGKAVQQLHAGKSIMDIGTPDVSYLEKNHLKPLLGENWMEGHIIHIDHFENVVVNITRDQFEAQRKNRRFTISFVRNEVISHISETYADVAEGEKLAIFNAAGYLEIAINKGNAAGLLGLQGFSEKSQNLQNRLFYQTVRIRFE